MNYLATLPIAAMLSLSFAGNICAQEVISAKIDDNIIVIKGSGFGTVPPMVFWDDVEENLTTTGLTDGDNVPTGNQAKWTATPNQWATPFMFEVNSETKNKKVNAFYHGYGKKNYLGKPLMSRDLDEKRIYVSWWYKPSMSPSAEGGSNKFIRIWDDPEGYGTRISWTQMHITCGERVSWANWNGKVGEWNHHEIYADLNQNNVKAWVNGNLIHNHTDCPKSSTFDSLPLFIGLIGFDHGSESYGSMQTSIDDIYIASSLMRFEMTANPVWNATHPREIIPIKNWSDTSIEGDINKSSIVRTGSEIYLHVFDINGNLIQSGISVDCTTCPKL